MVDEASDPQADVAELLRFAGFAASAPIPVGSDLQADQTATATVEPQGGRHLNSMWHFDLNILSSLMLIWLKCHLSLSEFYEMYLPLFFYIWESSDYLDVFGSFLCLNVLLSAYPCCLWASGVVLCWASLRWPDSGTAR